MWPVCAVVLTVAALVTGGVPQSGQRTCEDMPQYRYLHVPQPEHEIGDVLSSRVTYYTLQGKTCSGTTTELGTAACSWDIPLGTRLRFSDGFTVTCLDRGTGVRNNRGYPHWVDVWAPSSAWGLQNVERDYGLTTELTVVRWGY